MGLLMPAVTDQAYCVQCGQKMPYWKKTLVCSRNCQMRRYRAINMLAGTHGWVGGQFKRLPMSETR